MRAVSSFSPSRRAALQRTQLCLAISAMLVPVWSFAAPVVGPNGGVTSGTATIVQNGAVTDINQSSNKAVINWQSFSTSPNETVNFNQPNAASITLNRVIGNEQSVLQGALNATGKVFLVNPNGVLISTGATVNTGGFLASTLNITDEDFNKGNYTFKGNGSTASVTNLGTITVTDGGYVVLMGHLVSNQGAIVATKGSVSLNAGNKVTLNFNGNSLLSVTIDEGALNALVENKQAIYADGGQVILTAKAADELLSSQVNNTGIVQAQTIDDLKGTIEIYAHGGTANIAGKLDASAPITGDGGFIETSGDRVKIADSAQILTRSATGKNGKWLVDPVDFTIAASGGDMTGAFLSNYLNTQGDYEVKSVAGSKNGNGDIHVNDAIRWGSDNRLTLTAQRDININNAITLDGAGGGLTLNYGGDYNIRTKASYSGTVLDANGKPVAKEDTSGGVYGSVTFTNTANANGLVINGNTYTLIHSVDQLDFLDGQNSANGYYYNPTTQTYDVSGLVRYMNPETQVYDRLTPAQSNVTWDYYNPLTGTYNLSDFKGTEKYYNVATGSYDLAAAPSLSGRYALAGDFDASGARNTAVIANLSGTLAGMGHTIRNLTIDAPGTDNIGLIAQSGNGSVIRDIGMLDVNITGKQFVGGLVGQNRGGNIHHVYVSGAVAGSNNVGGLVGSNESSSTKNSSISSSFSTADVTGVTVGGLSAIGGLVGRNFLWFGEIPPSISSSHATGKVTSISPDLNNSNNNIGGLVGQNTSVIADSYYAGASVTVSMNASTVGGLVGLSGGASGVIRNSFADTNVIGGLNNIGGFVGSNNALITNSHVIANVSAGQPFNTQNIGGFAGSNGSAGVIDGFSVKATVTAPGNIAGGVAGNNAGRILNGVVVADVTVGTGGYAGGIAGLNNGTISGITLSGSVSGEITGREAAGNTGAITNIIEPPLPPSEPNANAVAARQAILENAGQQLGSAAQSMQRDVQSTLRQLSTAEKNPSIDSQIVFADTQNFSADVKSIVVDGVRFNLEDSSNPQDKESRK